MISRPGTLGAKPEHENPAGERSAHAPDATPVPGHPRPRRRRLSQAGGGNRLGPGTLYGALDRLSDQGMIKATRTEVLNGRLRRYYAISDAGMEAVREEAARRSEVLTAARARLRLALP